LFVLSILDCFLLFELLVFLVLHRLVLFGTQSHSHSLESPMALLFCDWIFIIIVSEKSDYSFIILCVKMDCIVLFYDLLVKPSPDR
jgi:hypothetical protein